MTAVAHLPRKVQAIALAEFWHALDPERLYPHPKRVRIPRTIRRAATEAAETGATGDPKALAGQIVFAETVLALVTAWYSDGLSEEWEPDELSFDRSLERIKAALRRLERRANQKLTDDTGWLAQELAGLSCAL